MNEYITHGGQFFGGGVEQVDRVVNSVAFIRDRREPEGGGLVEAAGAFRGGGARLGRGRRASGEGGRPGGRVILWRSRGG